MNLKFKDTLLIVSLIIIVVLTIRTCSRQDMSTKNIDDIRVIDAKKRDSLKKNIDSINYLVKTIVKTERKSSIKYRYIIKNNNNEAQKEINYYNSSPFDSVLCNISRILDSQKFEIYPDSFSRR